MPNTQSDPPGRSTEAGFAKRMSGSIQWNALKETTASKRSSAGSQPSNEDVTISTCGIRGELAARELGEVRAELDRKDREATLGERKRCLAGSATDLEHASARRKASQLDKVVEALPLAAAGRTSS